MKEQEKVKEPHDINVCYMVKLNELLQHFNKNIIKDRKETPKCIPESNKNMNEYQNNRMKKLNENCKCIELINSIH